MKFSISGIRQNKLINNHYFIRMMTIMKVEINHQGNKITLTWG